MKPSFRSPGAALFDRWRIARAFDRGEALPPQLEARVRRDPLLRQYCDGLERVERDLRSGVQEARRAPPSNLRASILAELERDARRALERHGPGARGAMGSPSRFAQPGLAIAAAALVTTIVWLAWFDDALPPSSKEAAVVVTSARSEGARAASAVNSALGGFELGSPGASRLAIDAPLFAEASNVARDTSQAARFLLNRVTTPFMLRASPR